MSENFINEADRPKVFYLQFKPQVGSPTAKAIAIAKSPDDACERLRRQFKGAQVLDCVAGDEFPVIGPEVVDSILAANMWNYVNHQTGGQPLHRQDDKDEYQVPEKKLERVFL